MTFLFYNLKLFYLNQNKLYNSNSYSTDKNNSGITNQVINKISYLKTNLNLQRGYKINKIQIFFVPFFFKNTRSEATDAEHRYISNILYKIHALFSVL